PFSPHNPLREYSVLNWLVEKKTAYHLHTQDETYQWMQRTYPQIQGIEDPSSVLKMATVVKEGETKYELADQFANGRLMELALTIEVLHVCLGMARYIRHNPVWIGWIIAVIGAFIYIPSYIKAPSLVNYVFGLTPTEAHVNGEYLMIGGFSLACLISLYK